ncbi:MAG: redoxin family protein [Bacteroidales bacterium]|nr:redoxin family protein [Bacteroidales bacterium]
MKVLFTSALLALPLMALAQSRVVENPEYGSKSIFTEYLNIERVEVKKDTTKITLNSYMPYEGFWAQISGDAYIVANGQHLPLIKAEGIQLNEPFYAPSADNRNRRFTLCFPEIDKDVESIDFIESDCPRCFKIWNVAVTEKMSAKLKAEKDASAKAFAEAMVINDDSKPLSEAKFMIGKSTLKCKILGYSKELFGGEFVDILCYINNPLTLHQESFHPRLSEEGTFEIELPLVLENQTIGIQIPPVNTTFVARCNGTEELIIDLKTMFFVDKNRTTPTGFWYFKGDNADLNNAVAKSESRTHYITYNDVTSFSGKTPAEYKEYIYSLGKKSAESIDAIDIPAMAKEYLKIVDRGRMAYYLFMGSYFMEKAYGRVNNNNNEAFETPVLDKEYYQYVKDLKLNDMDILYSDDYYTIPSNVLNSYIPPITLVRVVGAMKNAGTLDAVGENVLELLKTLEKEKRVPTEKENDTVSAFIKEYMAFNPKIEDLIKTMRMEDAQDMLGMNSGIMFDLREVQEICNGFDQSVSATDNQIAYLEKLCSPVFAEYAKMRSAEILAIIEAARSHGGYTICRSNETEADALLADLIKDHVGKVVFIDIWASWCAPCRLGIEKMKPLEPELEAKGVDFVYITDESTPENAWNNMILDIKGSHYRLKSEVLNKLKEKFNFSGIPSYIFVNKKGEVAHTNVGFGGIEPIVSKLNELLAE